MQACENNPDAEHAVIGAAMLDRGILPEITDIIVASDFYSDGAKLIWQAIVDIDAEDSMPDLVAVTNRLRNTGMLERCGGAAVVSGMVDIVPDTANGRHYAGIVRDFSVKRQLAAMSMRLGNATDVKRAIEELQVGLDSISGNASSTTTASLGDVAVDVATRAGALSRGEAKIRGFKSGFNGIDRLITTLHPTEYILLAGRPSLGKTTLGCNIAMNVAKGGGTVLFVSLEMNRSELVERMMATEADIDTRSFRSGKFDLTGAPNDIERATDAAKVFADRKIIIDDRSSMTTQQLRSLVRRVAGAGPLDLVVIDYLQLMRGAGSNANEIYGNISRSLKCMAKDSYLPFLVLSQLSRSPESEGRLDRPRLSDLRDSGSLEQDADKVIFLVRDMHESPRVAQAQVAKNRQGPIGDAPLTFNPGISLFEDGDWKNFMEGDE